LEVTNRPNPDAAEDAAIIGAGPTGLTVAMVCKTSGVQVIVTDPLASRREAILHKRRRTHTAALNKNGMMSDTAPEFRTRSARSPDNSLPGRTRSVQNPGNSPPGRTHSMQQEIIGAFCSDFELPNSGFEVRNQI
jgi:flavin-dependent dehydrogenase